MLDKILVDIISTLLGFVGLVGAITRFDFPNARKAVYGENLFAIKENIINKYITWLFTLYSAIGILFQLLFGVILDKDFPERQHTTSFYVLMVLFGIFISAILVQIIKVIARYISEKSWRTEISKKAKENYYLANKLIQEGEKSEAEKSDSQQTITKIVDWLEELFETKAKKRDLHSRIDHFKSFFDNQ